MEREFQIGKYKGQSINKIIETDPRYVKWMLDTVRNFNLTLSEQYKLNNMLCENISLK